MQCIPSKVRPRMGRSHVRVAARSATGTENARRIPEPKNDPRRSVEGLLGSPRGRSHNSGTHRVQWDGATGHINIAVNWCALCKHDWTCETTETRSSYVGVVEIQPRTLGSGHPVTRTDGVLLHTTTGFSKSRTIACGFQDNPIISSAGAPGTTPWMT